MHFVLRAHHHLLRAHHDVLCTGHDVLSACHDLLRAHYHLPRAGAGHRALCTGDHHVARAHSHGLPRRLEHAGGSRAFLLRTGGHEQRLWMPRRINAATYSSAARHRDRTSVAPSA